MSDLHLEMHRDGGKAFIKSLDPTGVDALVLAGDICYADRVVPTLKAFGEKYKYLVYTPGNHEYYGCKDRQRFLVDMACANMDYSILMFGQPCGDLVGGTLWFNEEATLRGAKDGLNDFYQIPNFESWVYLEHDITVAGLEANVKSDSLVVTHHLPHPNSIGPEYKDSPLNPFFLHDCSILIEERQPKLWIHGHTHDSFDYMVGETRVVCNPRGYPHEVNPKFNPKLVIEV